jgi:hypothetical protein
MSAERRLAMMALCKYLAVTDPSERHTESLKTSRPATSLRSVALDVVATQSRRRRQGHGRAGTARQEIREGLHLIGGRAATFTVRRDEGLPRRGWEPKPGLIAGSLPALHEAPCLESLSTWPGGRHRRCPGQLDCIDP